MLKVDKMLPMELLGFNNIGCIPPFLPSDENIEYISPYLVTWEQFSEFFSTNEHRKNLVGSVCTLLSLLSEADVNVVRCYIGGSFVSSKPDPQDVDMLVCWKPKIRVNCHSQLIEFTKERAAIFNYVELYSKFNIQVHFQGLLGISEIAVNQISKWVFLNSYHTESKTHRGIISLKL